MTSATDLTPRDLQILTKGLQLHFSDKLQCAVCGAPAPLSDTTAGAKVGIDENNHFIVYPLCSEHKGTAHHTVRADTKVPWIPLDDFRYIAGAYRAFVDWSAEHSPHRYFVCHPITPMVPAEYREATWVAVVDCEGSDGTPAVLGVVPAPLLDKELDEPLWCASGAFAAECLEGLNQLREGKREYHIAGNLIIAEADAPPEHIENPRRQG